MSVSNNMPFEDDDDSLVILPDPPNAHGEDGTGREECRVEEVDMETEENADGLRATLRENINELCTRKRLLNILIMGKPSQGKSAFLLSCATAALKKWNAYLMVGSEGGRGKSYMTVYLKRFSLMNPREDDPMIESKKPEDPEEAFIREHSPRFFDMAGMPDEDSKKTREVIRRILYGGIPLGTPLLQVMQEASQNGPDYVRKKYWKRNDSLAIDRIIVVMSSVEEHPTGLVDALMKVAQPKGVPDPDDGYIYKRAVPVFGLVTMMDKTAAMNKEEFEKFNKRVDSFAASLSMIGAMERLGKVTNYFSNKDEVVPKHLKVNDPKKDCKILQFLDYVMDPYLMVEHEEDVPYRPVDYTKYLREIWQWVSKRSTSELLNGFLIIIIAMIMFVWLSKH